MALPAQQWKYVGSQSFVSGTVAAALDALYTLGTAATYADGSARTPGSDSAGTYSRYQNVGVTEAIYCTPATANALNQRLIWAGSASVGSATMAAPDTYLQNHILVSVNKNSGAFNAWDAALPFTSGEFFGYWERLPLGMPGGRARRHRPSGGWDEPLHGRGLHRPRLDRRRRRGERRAALRGRHDRLDSGLRELHWNSGWKHRHVGSQHR